MPLSELLRAVGFVNLLLLEDTRSPTKLEPSDVVLITGGGSGLGAELTQLLSRYCTVVVLDMKIPESANRITGVFYYKCDTSNVGQVESAAADIEARVGRVTAVINNAGITHNKPLLHLSLKEIDQVIKVNLYSAFVTTKVFLPGMIEQHHGYIVNIASVLGYISPANLSAYGASKAGMVALHESLTYELGRPSTSSLGVKTLLICPGQMDTQMFSHVATPSTTIAPVLSRRRVAQQVVGDMRRGKVGERSMPFYTNLIPVIRSLPWQLAEVLRQLSHIDTAVPIPIHVPPESPALKEYRDQQLQQQPQPHS